MRYSLDYFWKVKIWPEEWRVWFSLFQRPGMRCPEISTIVIASRGTTLWSFERRLWRRWWRISSTLDISQRSTPSLPSKSGPGWHKLDRGYPKLLGPSPSPFGRQTQLINRLEGIVQMSLQKCLHLLGYKSLFPCTVALTVGVWLLDKSNNIFAEPSLYFGF